MGYAIMEEVIESTKGRIKMGPGTLYGTIKRLLEARIIEESDERPDPELDDERRRYYRLTAIGERVVKAEAMRYATVVEVVRRKRLIRRPVAATPRRSGRRWPPRSTPRRPSGRARTARAGRGHRPRRQ